MQSDSARLRAAVIIGNKAMIVDMLEEDVYLGTTDDNGDTLLHLAFSNVELSQAQLIEILEIFLHRNISINVKNKVGKTILHLAIERRMRDVIDFCIRQNADLYVKDYYGDSIGHIFIKDEYKKFISLTTNYFMNEYLERHENESSSFVDWLVSKRIIDFSHRANHYTNHSPLHLANILNLQHILLTLLKHTSTYPSIMCGQTPFAFLETNDKSNTDFNSRDLVPIDSMYYKSRHVFNIVKILLDKINVDNKTLITALRSAIASNQEMNVVEMLLQRITRLDCSHGETLMQTFTNKFCESNDTSKIKNGLMILKKLILKYADIDVDDDDIGELIAHKLFRHNPTFEMLDVLFEAFADFNLPTVYKGNFLHLISQHCMNGARMIDLVVKKGCDINKTDVQGNTPLMIAIKHKNKCVARRLINLGAKVNLANTFGRSPLSLACETGQTQVIEELIANGADFKFRDNNDRTLLHLAGYNLTVVKLLLKNGVDVNAKDDIGKTPLHSTMSGAIVEILSSAGAHVDARDKEGNTPLYYALNQRNFPVITELLKYGADIREPKVFEALQKHFQQSNTIIDSLEFRGLKQHFVKLIAAGLSNQIPYYAPTGIDEASQNFFKQCLAEVELLKNFIVDDYTSVYKFLHKNRNRACAYIDNEKLKDLKKDVAIFKQKFPNYFGLILGCYNNAVTRKPLLESAINVFNDELTEIPLPVLCIDEIFTHLTNMDLMIFIEACKNVSRND